MMLLHASFVLTMSAQGPPIFTDTPIMLGLQGGGIRTFGKLVSRTNGTSYTHPIAIPYNISRLIQVGGIASLVGHSPNEMDGKFGFGDLQLFAKFQIHQKDGKGKTFRTLIKLVESFPTAASNDLITLGSDAFATSIGLVTGYITTEFGIYGEIAYTSISNSIPDNFIANVAFGLPLLPQQYPPKQLNLFLEMNGKLTTIGQGESLFISPGVQWILGRKVLIESGIQIPLAEDIPETLKIKYMLSLGTRILLF